MAEPEPENSPMHNYLSGSGCGCGCLGALIGLFGTIIVGVIPLGFYAEATSAPMIVGGAALVCGLLVAVLGLAMYIGALFVD